MKNKKLFYYIFTVAVILMTVLTLCACSGSGASYITATKMIAFNNATDYDALQGINTFAPNAKQIILVFTYKNIPEKSRLYCVLMHNGEERMKSSYANISNLAEGAHAFTFLRGDQYWEEGKYTAEVYAEGVEKPIKTVKFKVSSENADTFITDVCLTSALADGKPVDSLTNFTTSSSIIIVWGTAINAPENTDIKILIKFEGNIVSTNHINIGDIAITYFNVKVTSSKPWVKGNYSAEVYLNEGKKPLHTIDFTISE